MAYDTEKLFTQALEVVEKYKCIFIEDVVSFLPCGKSAFYEHFPAESEKMEAIKEKIEVNRVTIKVNIRKKLLDSNKAAELLALYRLICTEDEHKLLNQQYVDHTSKGKKLSAGTTQINFIGHKQDNDE